MIHSLLLSTLGPVLLCSTATIRSTLVHNLIQQFIFTVGVQSGNVSNILLGIVRLSFVSSGNIFNDLMSQYILPLKLYSFR